MSTKNRTNSIKIVFENIIGEVFERVYNQMPLGNIDYPFAVYELFIVDDCPGMKAEIMIDMWDNDANQLSFQNKVDELIDKLDYISYDDGSICLSGNIETIQDVVTQEEELIRCQIKGIYDISKVG
jgi:hypothetical protein